MTISGNTQSLVTQISNVMTSENQFKSIVESTVEKVVKNTLKIDG